ncbi:tetratricopeptide repeat protein [Jidongwangia harbinensis]|uniref:tetratricopeptide repeat protein n=1 Tax=Jidongwangia harbinensis TaxID=2878561 RepID=UPI001CDA37A7|nr:tetratricopeptide repeat protein [Jidongwangia harbinensis]MCA2213590.1 tetratricopeptide repeat protein [Jidongwangia harbinensis]
MSSSPSESETTPEEYRQRALLFADLGRYDEAASEIAAGLAGAPGDAALLTTLARIHLIADQPAEALIAAERAGALAPEQIGTLVVRAMALTDSRRFGDAAQVAAEVLRRWPDDAFAQRTGAALLSEARNGQEALNAAWSGVRIAPTEAEAHLVLAVVAARLRLFDLAQRAYAEALDLDPAIGDAQRDVGVVRLERRRWAIALEALADQATLDTSPPPPPPAESFPRAYPAPDRPEPAPDAYDPTLGAPGPPGPPPIARPSGPVLDPSADSADGIRQAVLYGTNGVLVAALLTAVMSTVSSGVSRVWAGCIGVVILVAVLVWLSRRLLEPVGTALSRLRTRDRRVAVAAYGTFTAPLLVVGYALVGGLAPLVAAMVVAAVAELLVITRR